MLPIILLCCILLKDSIFKLLIKYQRQSQKTTAEIEWDHLYLICLKILPGKVLAWPENAKDKSDHLSDAAVLNVVIYPLRGP